MTEQELRVELTEIVANWEELTKDGEGIWTKEQIQAVLDGLAPMMIQAWGE